MKLLHRRTKNHHPIDLNVIPLIDVVFFLLIFYVISTSFTQESAVSIKRPNSTQTTTVDGTFVPVVITKSGSVQIGAQLVELARVREAVKAALVSEKCGHVVIISDREVPTGVTLQVMDQCDAAGASSVDIAATKATE